MNQTPESGGSVVELSPEECWKLLGSQQVGRLITVSDGRPEIYPVNYVTSDGRVYFRTDEGSKLSEIAVHPMVAFEVDEIRDHGAWSVVIHGPAHILRGFEDAARIDALGLKPWVPSPKYNYVELRAGEITGRRFTFVEH